MRKSIDIEIRSLQTPRQRVWAAILKLAKGFTVASLQDACEPMVSEDVVRDYLRELEGAGFVRCSREGERTQGTHRYTSRQFDLVKRQAEAPRLDHGEAVTQGLMNLAMWRAMKVHKTFSARDLAQSATLGGLVVKKGTALVYARALAQAGYLQPVEPPKPGRTTTWRLVRNTGPHAPAVSRRRIAFDRNTGQIFNLETAQEVADGVE